MDHPSHQHPLSLQYRGAEIVCDQCNQHNLESDQVYWACTTCNYDLCRQCFQTALSQTVTPALLAIASEEEQSLISDFPSIESIKLVSDVKQIGMLRTNTHLGCQLRSCSIKVIVSGVIARTFISQVYTNDEKNPVEVEFEFPIDEDATVTSFVVIQ